MFPSLVFSDKILLRKILVSVYIGIYMLGFHLLFILLAMLPVASVNLGVERGHFCYEFAATIISFISFAALWILARYLILGMVDRFPIMPSHSLIDFSNSFIDSGSISVIQLVDGYFFVAILVHDDNCNCFSVRLLTMATSLVLALTFVIAVVCSITPHKEEVH